ncbi:cyd operon protein YbgT [Paraglaciecola sp. T6c]|nr:cyd operon protein YbgT [Paraglaciecola sp. T6c]
MLTPDIRRVFMWYFAWILGVLLACTLGVINVMWYEFHQNKDSIADDEKELYERLQKERDN